MQIQLDDGYKDSPEVAARRAEVDARGLEYARRNISLGSAIAAIRQKAVFDFLIGDRRDEFELFFINAVDAVYDKIDAENIPDELEAERARALLTAGLLDSPPYPRPQSFMP